jgi:putative ATPase
MLISACEDTGLADPTAITVVESSAAAFDRVGLPEGRYFLAHAALYLSTAPKSNSSMAFFDALSSVEKEDKKVPNPMRDDSRDAEEFGHGAGYLYPHAYRDHWVAQQYLPDDLMGRVFYTPSDQGYEAHIRADVLSRRELQIAALLEKTEKDAHEHGYEWQDRLDSNRADVLREIRDAMLLGAGLQRNTRVFIWNADDALLLLSAVRSCIEGAVCGVCRNEKGRAVLEQYARTLDDIDKPLLTVQDAAPPAGGFYTSQTDFRDIPFDRLFFRDVIISPESIIQFRTSLEMALTSGQLATGWKCVIAQRIPVNGQRLSSLIRGQILQNRESSYASVLNVLEVAETRFYADPAQSLFAWDADTIAATFASCDFTAAVQTHVLYEKRRLTPEEVQNWFNTESPYGKAIRDALGDEIECIKEILLQAVQDRQLFDWKIEVAIVTISENG